MYKKLLLLLIFAVSNPSYSMARFTTAMRNHAGKISSSIKAEINKPAEPWMKEGMKHKPQQSLAVMAGILYWTTKISLWTATVLTAGVAVKGGADALKGNSAVSKGTISTAESLANSSVKLTAGYGLTTCATDVIAVEAFAWGGGPATGIPAAFAIPALGAAATANPATAATVMEVANAATITVATQAPTIVTAKSIVVGACVGHAANIEAAAVAAGTLGMAFPWF